MLVLGASGFLGANLLRTLLLYRDDVYGTLFHAPARRLDGVPARHAIDCDLLMDPSRNALLERLKPRTVFNCVGYGYSFESDSELVYETNFNLTAKLLQRLESMDLACYVHSVSSSEHGDRVAAAKEDDLPQPNSTYAVSKVASANLVRLYGKTKHLPCVNLRLFSIRLLEASETRSAGFMRIAYKLFYRLFDAMSYLSIPYDAGDFSLIDRRAVDAILRYLRPARRFGRTTNGAPPLPGNGDQRRHHDPARRAFLRLAEPVRNRRIGRVHRQDPRGDQAAPALRAQHDHDTDRPFSVRVGCDSSTAGLAVTRVRGRNGRGSSP